MGKAAKDKEGLFTLNKNIRTALIACVILISVGMVFLLFTAAKGKYTDNKVSTYSYSSNGNVNYDVFLVPNILYNQKSLQSGGTYISDFVDYINTDFLYEFDGEGPAEVNGKYNVVAVVEGLLNGENGSKSIWKKEYLLQPETSFKGSTNSILVDKKLPIKLGIYNDFAQEVIKASNVNFDTKLTVQWNVSVEARTDKGTVTEILSPTMEIPLNSTLFEIGGNLSPMKNGSIEKTVKVISPSYKKRTLYSGAVLALCLMFLLFLLILTAPGAEMNSIEKKLKHILKMHGDRLVSVNNEVAVAAQEVIEVSSIDDLVRVSDDMGRPVLYNCDTNSGGQTTFYVIDEGIIYVLRLDKKSEEQIIDENDKNDSRNMGM